MLKYYCDMCGKHINMNVDGVTLWFNAKGISIRNAVDEDKHLCSDCCNKVKSFITKSAESK
mgnify:FL=1